MAIRFQVEPDFYDHPKCIGMSDAATALWTRAGSYSAAKLTDGFIAEHVLAELSKTPEEAAAELVARGLWKRKRGGYVFHQWSPRNLTRQEVEEKRERDRRRKRREPVRKTTGKSAKPQVSTENFHVESERNPNGIHVESEGIPRRGPNTTQHNSVVLLEGSKEPSRPRNKRGTPKGTRIPDDFTVTEDMKAWKREKCPNVDGWREHEKFTNYWQAKPGRDATKVDWVKTWKNWMLNAEERAGRTNTQRPDTAAAHSSWTPPEPPEHIANDLDAYRKWYADQVANHRGSNQ